MNTSTARDLSGTVSAAAGANPVSAEPKQFVFLLLNGFSLMALVSALEVLDTANRVVGQSLFGWQLCGQPGVSATSSLGIGLPVHAGLECLGNKDTLIVCGGADARRSATLPVISWLRREARKGVSIGGFGGGSIALAKAGLLDGHHATVHWDSRDSFREDFPEVDLSDKLYVVDRKRFTTAGGISSINLMLALIDQEGIAGLSTRIAGQMNYSGARTIQEATRMSVSERVNVRHPKLVAAFAMMESNIEDVLSPHEIAAAVGLSCRQLERLFKAHVLQAPMSFYQELRLQRAARLLTETSMPIIEIAFACGFGSTSHFSKKFRKSRGVSAFALRNGNDRQC